MRLSNNFYLSEFTKSQIARRYEIPMTPPESIIESLEKLCQNLLQPIRDEVGPIIITSGWRPTEVNKILGGSTNSYHITGDAADFIALDYSPAELFERIKGIDKVQSYLDKIILEFDEWNHMQQAKPGQSPRRQYLVAEKEDGKTVYSFG